MTGEPVKWYENLRKRAPNEGEEETLRLLKEKCGVVHTNEGLLKIAKKYDEEYHKTVAAKEFEDNFSLLIQERNLKFEKVVSLGLGPFGWKRHDMSFVQLSNLKHAISIGHPRYPLLQRIEHEILHPTKPECGVARDIHFEEPHVYVLRHLCGLAAGGKASVEDIGDEITDTSLVYAPGFPWRGDHIRLLNEKKPLVIFDTLYFPIPTINESSNITQAHLDRWNLRIEEVQALHNSYDTFNLTPSIELKNPDDKLPCPGPMEAWYHDGASIDKNFDFCVKAALRATRCWIRKS
ncbi:MAG: hypothetical protein Q9162_007584 [Coniocarpon cinnabarinum]